MRLNREQKEGRITTNKIKMEFAIALTIGNLAFGGMMVGLVAAQNKMDNDQDKDYNNHIEAMIDSNLDDDVEIVLDKMNESIDLINDYNLALGEEKDTYLDKMVSEKDNLRKLALQLVKIHESKEHGGSWDEYEIQEGEGLVAWTALRTIYDEYGVSHGSVYNLDGDSAKLVNAVVTLDNSSYLNGTTTEKNKENFIRDYQDVINQAATFVGKQAEKTGKAK